MSQDGKRMIHSVTESELSPERGITLGGAIPFGQRQFLGRDSAECCWPPMLPMAGRMRTSISREEPEGIPEHPLYPESDLKQCKMESNGL